ncbi:glycosyltransferase family 2 protein [Listeria booriae]|uniref:glycosyltransferase family 2 protein n=1 Tax=Listeria booriae TaxID=1552123 RepID=UPI001625C532|nr:glycosyltransferase family 2 protein [Listeria booriae]MBC1228722.1 glycosyltransferase family 2 protein [Listeria booriae]MBC1273785.1 glycosyltransferase family 2 protein [Listeria booriae]
MQDLVSIVIPTKNRATTLEKAIKSVLTQTYSPIEICVIIDGPDQETRQMLDKYLGRGICIHIHETKGVGGSTARNIGVQVADGKWIAFLDDDDEFMPEKLEKQLSLLDHNYEARHLSFSSVLTYEAGCPTQTFILPDFSWQSNKYTIGEYLFSRKGRKTMGFIQTSTLLIPRELLLEIPFTNGLKKHQDWDLMLRMEQAGVEIKQLESPETIYHQQVSTRKRIGQQNIWQFSEQWAQKMNLSINARDSFMLSIVIRGIAMDKTLSRRTRQREIMIRVRKISWNWKHMVSYFYMIAINLVRVYLK